MGGTPRGASLHPTVTVLPVPPHRRPSVSASCISTFGVGSVSLGVGLFLGGGLSHWALEEGAWVGFWWLLHTLSYDWSRGKMKQLRPLRRVHRPQAHPWALLTAVPSQDVLMQLAKAVASAAAALVLKAKSVAQRTEDSGLQSQVIAAATQCALSTSQLVACTKVSPRACAGSHQGVMVQCPRTSHFTSLAHP